MEEKRKEEVSEPPKPEEFEGETPEELWEEAEEAADKQ